ncbi:MAG: SpoIIE family protein phosphatase [Ruminococcus sp.]|nr:SpoIIE family protein phosphatase [Ruminococcus sp.]
MSYTSPEKSKAIAAVVWETAGAFLCGLILACAELGGISSPIPVAVAASVSPFGAAAVLLGALITGSVAGTLMLQLPLILSLMLTACVRVILREYHSARFVCISSALSVFAAGMVVSFSQNSGAEGLLLHLMSALLTGTTAYFMDTVLDKLRNQKKIPLHSSVGCAAAVVYFVLIGALSSFQLSFINPGYIIGITVTLIAAQRFRYTGGVICGALTACGAMLSAEDSGVGLIFLPVTGLLAGYMADMGCFAAAGVFFLFNALAQLTFQTGAFTYAAIGNLLLGCIAYLLLHTICLDQWIVTEQLSSHRMMQNLAVRMRFMAQSIGSVRADTEKIAGLLTHPVNGRDVCTHVTYAVCRACAGRDTCWKKHAERTSAGFLKLQTVPSCTPRELPAELRTCCRKELLCSTLAKEQKRIQLKKIRIAQKEESRRLVFEQLIAAEEMLSSFGERMAVRYSSELTDGIERRLDRYGYSCDSIVAYYNDRERLMIEFYCKDRQLEDCMAAICHILTEMLGITLEELEPVGTKESVRYRLCQAPPYQLRQYSTKRCAEGGVVSGDTTLLFQDGTGCAYVVLSDGMGTGKSAAVESRMTAEMFRKLISSGVAYEAALRVINGLMLTKSEEEGFATLDAARFDLDSGEMTLIKSGAASTLLRHKGQVLRICAPTFPIGADASPDIYTRQFPLLADDIIVMLSDGIQESQYPFIKDLLLSSDDLTYIANEICKKSVIFGGGRCRDDVSVTVMQILENSLC